MDRLIFILETNIFPLAHPAYFINHLDQAGLLLENPYFGKTISNSTNGGAIKTVTVVNNPGFAPVYTRGEEEYYFNDTRMAVVPGLFNQDYLQVSDYAERYIEFYHSGIDFRGSKGTEIHSFIHGRVIASGWMNSNYGMILLIKDLYQNDTLYFLAHLNKILVSEEEYVYPGQVVAEVGGSGKNRNPEAWPTHLHLEVWKNDEAEKETIFDHINGNLSFRTRRQVFVRSRVDPFCHFIPQEEDISR